MRIFTWPPRINLFHSSPIILFYWYRIEDIRESQWFTRQSKSQTISQARYLILWKSSLFFLLILKPILKICKYYMAQMSESEILYVYLQCCHMLSVSSHQNKCFEFFQNIACTWFERFLSVVWKWDKWNSQFSSPFFIPNTFLQLGKKEYRTVLEFFCNVAKLDINYFI